VRIGQGVAIVQQGSGLPGLDSANAAVTMLGDGTFMLLSGGADLGTGLDTVTTKMVAECLCTDMSDVALIAGDTDLTPFDSGLCLQRNLLLRRRRAERCRRDEGKNPERGGGDAPRNRSATWRWSSHPREGQARSVTYRQIAQHTQAGTGCGQLTATGNFVTDKASIRTAPISARWRSTRAAAK